MHIGDSIVFAVLSLAACIFVHWWLRSQRANPVLWLVWVLIAVLVVTSGIEAHRVEHGEKARLEGVLIGYAQLFAHHLERLGHSSLSLSTPADDPTYLAIIEAEKDWQRVVGVVHDVYTVRLLPDGRKAFLADSETDYDMNGRYEGETEARTPIGEIYEEDEPDEGMNQAFAGQGNFYLEPVRDRWGTWVSASWPLHDSSGKIEGIVGVDYEASAFAAVGVAARRRVLAFAGVLELLIVGAALLVGLARGRAREQEIASKELAVREERFRQFMDHSPAIAFTKDETGRFLYVNATHGRLLGRPAEEILGKRDCEIYPEEISTVLGEHDRAVIEKGKTLESLETMPDASGERRQWWVARFLLPSSGGSRQIGAVGMDVTERMKLEKDLRHTRRLESLGQLAAGVAHDFNNILTALSVASQGILEEKPKPAIADQARFIEREVNHASSLVRRLLAFGRRQSLAERPVDVAAVIRDNVEMLRRLLGASIDVSCEVDGTLSPVLGDAVALGQVIVNLGVNARDAMPSGGELRIRAAEVEIGATEHSNPEARPGRFVKLEVADTGSGMDAATLERIFEPFFTTKGPAQGSGLGLASAYGIVHQHRGWISVVSAVGEGATFRIFLPATDQAVKPADEPRPAASGRFEGVRVALVVEDNPSVKLIFRSLLRSEDRTILEASNVAEAVELWNEHRDAIDLVVTDMVMPGGRSGKELVEIVLRESQDVQVICTSGYSPDMVDMNALPHDRARFLEKPFSPKEFRAMVAELMELRAVEV